MSEQYGTAKDSHSEYGTIPSNEWISVVLPAPLPPMSVMISRSRIVRDTPLRTVTSPGGYRTTSPWTSTRPCDG